MNQIMGKTISENVEQQSQDFAQRIMSMNRHDRRAYAKQYGLGIIYGINKPDINEVKKAKRLKR